MSSQLISKLFPNYYEVQKYLDLLKGWMPAWFKKHFSLYNVPVTVSYDDLKNTSLPPDASRRDVCIVLGSGNYIKRSIIISRTVKNDLSKAVIMEVERTFPLKASALSISWVVTSQDDKNLHVDVYATRKTTISDLLQLAREAGLSVVSIVPEANVLRAMFRDSSILKKQFQRVLAAGLLTVTMSYCITLVPSLYKEKLLSATQALDNQIASSRKTTLKIVKLQKEVAALQGLQHAISQAKNEGLLLSVLSKLTESSPDTVVVDELRLDGNRLYLSGRAVAPEAWTLELEKEALFEAVRLTSVFDKENEEMRRFELNLNVVWKGPDLE